MVTVAVLPIKTFARAKHRLAEAVDVPNRRALAEAMVGDVLQALAAVQQLVRLVRLGVLVPWIFAAAELA